MEIRADDVRLAPPYPVTLECPWCGKGGSFEPFEARDIQIGQLRLGHRRCPNRQCWGHVFVIAEGNKVLASYPPQRIGFEREGLPDDVFDALEEAISCHANQCYVASAIMIRRTLEEICTDRQATGNSLKERIADLRNKVILPQELFDGMDDLRLLGNDAAHVESQVFQEVSQREVEVAIEFTKEILKATYQYKKLLEDLRSLKKDHTSP